MTLTFPAAYGKIPLISQPSPAERPDHEKNGESVMERIKTLEPVRERQERRLRRVPDLLPVRMQNQLRRGQPEV